MEGDKASTGFPVVGFAGAMQGFPVTTGFPKVDGFVGFNTGLMKDANTKEMEVNEPKEGTAPKNVKYFEGTSKLNKTATNNAWTEFGGERLATHEKDGSAFITRIIERESKKTGVYFKLTERLTKDVDGYGMISWRIDLGSIVRRKPAKQKFDEAWKDAILAKVRAVVVDNVNVSTAAKSLADELGVSFSTMRANLWVSDKWSRGETTTFLPHRSMINPIFDLLCELGMKDDVLQSMVAYSKAVKRPSEYVVAILKVYGLM